jgi:hypothetical protein
MTLSDSILKGLRTRRWDSIRDEWLKHTPIIDPAGSPSDNALSETIDFQSYARQLSVSTDPCLRVAGANLKTVVLWEAVFLLHKAAHVLSAAELHIHKGMLTWSLSTAYHASFFSCKAILDFLGICIAQYSKSIICDLWPEPDKIPKRRRNMGQMVPDEIVFWKTGFVLDHMSVWTIFLRIIAVTRIDIWPDQYIKVLRKMDAKDFAKQRNSIHNKNNFWTLEDLFTFVHADRFGYIPEEIVDYFDKTDEYRDSSVVLSFLLFFMAYALFSNIANQTNKLNAERDLILSNFEETKHPIYHTRLSSI